MKKRIRPVYEQYLQFAKHFPDFKLIDFRKDLSCSRKSDWLLIPKHYKIALSYGEALKVALNLLMQKKVNFVNKLDSNLEEIKVCLRTSLFLEPESRGDYYLVPIQTGDLHFGKSPKKAFDDFSDNEFFLGPYEVAMFLFLHPNWLDDETGIYCPGGMSRIKSEDVICFFQKEGVLSLENRWENCPNSKLSIITAFFDSSF